LAALDRLQADIVAGRSLDVAPFNTIASLQTLHRAAAAELGLDAEATTAQMAQALDEHRSQEAARASLARARRLEGPAGAAAAISRAQALAQELTERSDWADEDRALAGALTALLDLTECDPADLERLLACEAAARAGLPGDLLGLCALAGRGVHLSNGASQVPAASPVPADEPVTGALLTEPVVAPEEAQARAPVEKAPPAVFVPVDEPPAPQAPVEEAPPAASALAPGEPVPRGGVSWLPALVLVTAIGLLVVAVADGLARRGEFGARPLFWAGLAVVVAPLAYRLLSEAPSRRERIGLVVVLVGALYVVKILNNPDGFTFFDEFNHLRSLADVLRTGRLLQPNPLLSVAPRYPGLPVVTSAVVQVTGASAFVAGLTVIGLARLLLALGLFLLFERISGSSFLAGVGVLVYAANPDFLFFTADFSYESLALPLAIFCVLAVVMANDRAGHSRAAWLFVAAAASLATVLTHHLTATLLAAVLLLWALVAALLPGARRRAEWRLPAALGILTAGAFVAWALVVAEGTFSYIDGTLGPALSALWNLLLLRTGPHAPAFAAPAAYTAPRAEQVAAYLTVVVVLLALPVGLRAVRRTMRTSPAAVALAAGSLVYPVSLAARLTLASSETAQRASEFVFVGVGFVVAAGYVHWREGRVGSRRTRRRPLWRLATTAAVCVAIAGGIVVGWAPTALLPGPLLPGADQRSISPQGTAAAQWILANSGPGNVLYGDIVDRQIMGSVGVQDPTQGPSPDGRVLAQVFFDPSLTSADIELLQQRRVRFLVVDRRDSSALPVDGFYFENGEPNAHQETHPIPLAALDKFDAVAGIQRIFDSGMLVVYDVSTLGRGG
jgi:hypothetical protein